MRDPSERADELDQLAEAVTCRLADFPADEVADLLAELRAIRGELASFAEEVAAGGAGLARQSAGARAG